MNIYDSQQFENVIQKSNLIIMCDLSLFLHF